MERVSYSPLRKTSHFRSCITTNFGFDIYSCRHWLWVSTNIFSSCFCWLLIVNLPSITVIWHVGSDWNARIQFFLLNSLFHFSSRIAARCRYGEKSTMFPSVMFRVSKISSLSVTSFSHSHIVVLLPSLIMHWYLVYLAPDRYSCGVAAAAILAHR